MARQLIELGCILLNPKDVQNSDEGKKIEFLFSEIS